MFSLKIVSSMTKTTPNKEFQAKRSVVQARKKKWNPGYCRQEWVNQPDSGQVFPNRDELSLLSWCKTIWYYREWTQTPHSNPY